VDGQVVGEHARQFGHGKTVYNPWHYLPVLQRKPGALRNGAPFQDWDLPAPIRAVWRALGERTGGDREFVQVLNAMRTYGAEAIERAAREALALGAISFDVIFNLLSRQTEAVPPPLTEQLPEHLTLRQLPRADCGRYDQLLEGGRYAS
jgi:hypothetical protein